MQRHTWTAGLALLLLIGGCQGESPAGTAARDARDVAHVKALQKVHPPLQPIVPQPITPADMAEAAKIAQPHDTPGGSSRDESRCGFFPERAASGAPILSADAKRALLKVKEDLVVLASDSGSSKLMAGLYAKYAGRNYWVQLGRAPDALTVRDRFDRVVYEASGILRCDGTPAR